MGVLNYISGTSTPVSKNSSITPPLPDLILPKKHAGKTAHRSISGDRKYWGGEKDDPLTSDDYIWSREFMGRMKKLFKDQPHDLSVPLNKPKDEPSGFLSLNRAMTLDSLEVDLSKELMAAPTQRSEDLVEQKIQDVMLRESRRPKGDREVLASLSREQYFKLKKLQNLTLAIGAVGLFSSYVSYSPEVAVSFGAGLIGSLVYVRMLGSSVDSLADGAKELVKGAVAQPRILVPVILVMVYNRWNGILVEDYGVMQLQLIPMLLGFFTSKIATFVQALEEALKPQA